jgi:hypothetical protein
MVAVVMWLSADFARNYNLFRARFSSAIAKKLPTLHVFCLVLSCVTIKVKLQHSCNLLFYIIIIIMVLNGSGGTCCSVYACVLKTVSGMFSDFSFACS